MRSSGGATRRPKWSNHCLSSPGSGAPASGCKAREAESSIRRSAARPLPCKALVDEPQLMPRAADQHRRGLTLAAFGHPYRALHGVPHQAQLVGQLDGGGSVSRAWPHRPDIGRKRRERGLARLLPREFFDDQAAQKALHLAGGGIARYLSGQRQVRDRLGIEAVVAARRTEEARTDIGRPWRRRNPDEEEMRIAPPVAVAARTAHPRARGLSAKQERRVEQGAPGCELAFIGNRLAAHGRLARQRLRLMPRRDPDQRL